MSKTPIKKTGSATTPPPAGGIIATARNDITISNYTTTLSPQDDTLIQRGGGKGLALYREILRDGRAYTVFQKRRRALIARAWEVTPASEDATDVKAADLVRAQLLALPFDRIALNLLSAQLMGFSCAETVWERDGNEIKAKAVRAIKQERFTFDLDWKPRLLTREAMMDGIQLDERKFIVHRFEDDGSDPYGRGLGSIVFWHVLFKREGVAFWLKALERFAVPMPVAKYPYGMLESDQRKLLTMLSSAVANGSLVVPAGTDIEFAKGMISGSMAHADWCKYWDDQTAETVLGENLTTNISGNGSRAAAEVHKGIKDELIDGDADELAATLNETLIRWISEYNVPDATPPRLNWERPQNLNAEETAKKAQSDRQQVDLQNLAALGAQGFEPENLPQVLEDRLGFKVKPKAKPDVRSSTALTPPASFADLPHAYGYRDIVDQVDREAQKVRDGWIEQIRTVISDLLGEGKALADLPQALLELYPDLETGKLSQLLGDALAVSELKGRADLKDELA